jgi:hypothetical protein
MRQVGDTLVWLAMILVVAAVVYFAPRVAKYVASSGTEHTHDCTRSCELGYYPENAALSSR